MAGRNVGLDGVPAQQANHRRSGFRSAWNNIRCEGPPLVATPPAGVSLLDARSVPFDLLVGYDRRFFPEPRDSFLASWISLPERAAMVAVRDGKLAGFAVMRHLPGSGTCRATVRRFAGNCCHAGLCSGAESRRRDRGDRHPGHQQARRRDG
jgi:hypothetical protein